MYGHFLILPLNYCVVSHAISYGHVLTTPYTCLQSRRILAPPITRSPAITSTTVRTGSVSISTWWPIHAGHASSPIVDVHLAHGQEVHAVTFIFIEILCIHLQRKAATGAAKGHGGYRHNEDVDPRRLHRTTIHPPQCR
jgi:hypothetical protein